MHTFSRRLIPAALALGGLALLAAAPAHAQNLVKDGGFEQADTSQFNYNLFTPFDTSWIVTQGNVRFFTNNAASGALYDPNAVFDGSNSLFLTPDNSGTSEIAQGLATTPGESYTLSFYADDFATKGSQLLNVNFGNTVVSGGPITVPLDPNGFDGPPNYTFFSYTVTAATPFTGLTFSAIDDKVDYIGLDDISVVPAAVPEASTTVSFGLLLALGLGGLAVTAKKKAGASAA